MDLESAAPRLVGDRRFTAFIVLAAVLQQAVGHLNGDDSWFLTFAEKYRDGFVPYVDITDPNPPASFLASLPAILIGRILGMAPELVLATLTFLGAGVAIFLAGVILRRAGLLRDDETWPALAAAAYVLLFVPAFCFAEREHIALIALLPMICVGAARVAGGGASRTQAILAGVGCGLACTFKPYFLLPAACIVLCGVFARRKPILFLAPEVLAAGAVLILYGAAILILFPAYVSAALPLVAYVYAPLREQLPYLLVSPLFIANFALLAGLFFVSRAGKIGPRMLVLCAASAGFLATFLIQGKGWMNHAYPGIALALLAAASLISERLKSGGRLRAFALFVFVPALCVAPFLFGTMKDFGDGEEYAGLTDAVRRVAPAHPKIIALAEQLDVGHPLVRHLGGTWVGHQNCLWVSWGVRYLLAHGTRPAATRARLLDLMHQDEETFATDVAVGKPDILLVENADVEAWARTQPALNGVFRDYRQVAKASNVGVWVREQTAGR